MGWWQSFGLVEAGGGSGQVAQGAVWEVTVRPGAGAGRGGARWPHQRPLGWSAVIGSTTGQRPASAAARRVAASPVSRGKSSRCKHEGVKKSENLWMRVFIRNVFPIL